jgi:23S rRNA (adenine2503-C2)-methyltransferase
LAVSLHSVDDDTRSQMMPINRRYPIDDLLESCREYTLITGRRITFEWALIKDINDTPEQARLLATKVKDILCHINAIPLNPTALYEGKAASLVRANQFKNILLQAGIACTIRLRRGIDIDAGCGQLVIKNKYMKI